jgi:membrane dipeptidase
MVSLNFLHPQGIVEGINMVQLSERQEDEARRIHNEAIVIDTHCDTLMAFIPQPFGQPPARRLGERGEKGHLDLPRMIEGGVNCQTFALYTGRREGQHDALLTAMQMTDVFYREMEENKEKIVPVVSVGEILAAKEVGKCSALLSIEGAEPLMGDLGILRNFYKLGVRMLSFTWNWRTPFADGLSASRAESKLTDLGIKAIEEMDKLGIILDTSHISDTCFWDIADVKKGPFIASHSNSRVVCDHRRNLTDDMLKALADHGGVAGMNFAPDFVAKQGASVEGLVDHIDHIVKKIGPNHVGLGSDFDGIGKTPAGLEDASKMPNITRELVCRGYAEEDIKKILGGNHLRVFREVFK